MKRGSEVEIWLMWGILGATVGVMDEDRVFDDDGYLRATALEGGLRWGLGFGRAAHAPRTTDL